MVTGGSLMASGGCTDCQITGPSDIAAAIATEIGRKSDYHPVTTEGAAHAASMLASLL